MAFRLRHNQRVSHFQKEDCRWNPVCEFALIATNSVICGAAKSGIEMKVTTAVSLESDGVVGVISAYKRNVLRRSNNDPEKQFAEVRWESEDLSCLIANSDNRVIQLKPRLIFQRRRKLDEV